jgi:hypothetical protein
MSLHPTCSDQATDVARAERRGPLGASGRIGGIDGLRGLLLLLMTFNHLLLWPFDHVGHALAFTYQPIGFISAAEGFFFLSGVVAALAYGRIYERRGLKAVLPPLGRRIAKILVLNLVITFSIIALVQAGRDLAPHNAALVTELREHAWEAFLAPFLALNLPWLADILPLYILFLGLVPVLILAASARSERVVFIVVVGLWLFGQHYPCDALASRLMQWVPGHHYFTFGWFDIFAWYVIFASGFLLSLSSLRGQLPAVVRDPPRALVVVCGVVSLLLLVERHLGWPLARVLVDDWAAVRVMAPMRLLNFACVALLVRAAWRQLAPLIAKRPLTILGEASLGVFAYHVFVVYFMAWRYPNGSPWLVLAALVGVWPVAVGWLAFRKLRRAAGLKI